MAEFEIKMQHDEDTLEAMAHMQYDLFCKSNRIVRSLLSVGFILLGVVNHDTWWGILVIAYGCYLTTSTYASANHTARKLIAAIIDVLDDMCDELADVQDDLCDMEEGLDAVSDDLSEVEEVLYELIDEEEEYDEDM